MKCIVSTVSTVHTKNKMRRVQFRDEISPFECSNLHSEILLKLSYDPFYEFSITGYLLKMALYCILDSAPSCVFGTVTVMY